MEKINSEGGIGFQWKPMQIALLAGLTLAAFFALLSIQYTLVPTGDGLRAQGGDVLGNDFLFFYSASKLVLSGETHQLFDQQKFFALEEAIAGQRLQLPWAYPAHLLLFIAPLALFAYIPALYLWLAATTAPVIFAIRKFAHTPWLAIPILPPIIQNAICGQNGALTASLAGCGMLALSANRSLLAGLLFGCLAYKPQVFVLAPICLLAARDWRAFAGLAITAVGLPLLSLLIFGVDLWRMFFEHLPEQMSYVTSGRMPQNRFATIFILLFKSTGSEMAARVGQGISTVLAWALVYGCWRRTRDVFVRAFAFCVAMPLSTPYLFDYDYALWALPAAMLATRLWRGEGRALDLIPVAILAFLPPAIWMGSLAKTNYGVFAILALVPFLGREAFSAKRARAAP